MEFVFVVFFILTISFSNCLRGERIIKDDPENLVFQRVWVFGFEAGGEFSLFVNKTYGGTIQIALLSTIQSESVINIQETVTDPSPLCFLPFMMRYEIDNRTLNISSQIKISDQYSLFIINCNHTSFELEIDYHIKNPFAGEVPLDESPLIFIYCTLSVIYFLIFFGYLISFCIFYQTSAIHNTQICFLISVFCQIMEMICGILFYINYGETGNFEQRFLISVYRTMGSVGATFRMLLLILTSVGYEILFDSFTAPKYFAVFVFPVIYFLWAIPFILCRNNNCAIHFILLSTFQIVIRFGAIVALNINVERLRNRLTLPEEFGLFWEQEFLSIHHKAKTYELLRSVILFSYYILPLILVIIQETILSWKWNWIDHSSAHFSNLLASLYFSYCLRPDSPFLLRNQEMMELESFDDAFNE